MPLERQHSSGRKEWCVHDDDTIRCRRGRAHFHWEHMRQHVHRLMVIDLAREVESNDFRFFIVDVTISRVVEEIAELPRLIAIH